MQHRHLMYMYMYIMIYHTIGSTESQTRTEPDGVPPEDLLLHLHSSWRSGLLSLRKGRELPEEEELIL